MICKWSNLWVNLRSGNLRSGGRSALWTLPLLLAGCGLVWPATGEEEAPSPPGPVLYTAAGAVAGLASGPDGRLWAATGGGVLCWNSGTSALPRRWTTADGLASSDVRAVRLQSGGGVRVTTALGQDSISPTGEITPLPPAETSLRLVWDGKQSWAITLTGLVRQSDGHRLDWPEGWTAASSVGNVTGLAADGPGEFLATSLGFWRWTLGRWQPIPLPPGSPASHVSALTIANHTLIVGLYGDGLYQWTGGWRRLPGQPPACQWPTALAPVSGGLAVGTKSEGVWQEQNHRWQSAPCPPSLPSADIACLAAFRGALWAGSFDGGLLRLDSQGVARAFTHADGLRTDSPRGLAVFAGTLYVRHADGPLDCSADGISWHPAFAKAALPRPDVYALASDTHRLLLGGWAGWAATDGRVWERHYHDPELQGQVVTAIATQGDAVWIGTQKRGLLRYANGHYTAFQEPQGLTDDWITCLAVRGNCLLVGTYTGGLLEMQGEHFVVRLRPGAFAARTIAFRPDSGAALVATPLGLYQESPSGRWSLVDCLQSGGPETQAVLPATDGVWVGTRTCLTFLPWRALSEHGENTNG